MTWENFAATATKITGI